jgi:2-polyprenyl-3-methyl-5-hydroxy-6-metoxy-1,4-benzoquinol methylase
MKQSNAQPKQVTESIERIGLQRKNASRALALFERSPLKQKKWQMILTALHGRPEVDRSYEGKTCLDIGSDNGIISYLLRDRLGGTWYSTDLIPETVECIRRLVGERVMPMKGHVLPFPDSMFDCVVVVDMFEHLENDAEFANELKRVVKPGGVVVANVPNPVHGPVRLIKQMVGQTDAAHGHVRHGYQEGEIDKLLGSEFQKESEHCYSKAFSCLVDTAITGALDVLKGKRSSKGTVVSDNDLKKFQKSFKLFALIAPVLGLCSRLDDKASFLPGHMRIISFRRSA